MKTYDIVYKLQVKRWKNLNKLGKVRFTNSQSLQITLDNGQAKLENLSSDTDIFDSYFYEDLKN